MSPSEEGNGNSPPNSSQRLFPLPYLPSVGPLPSRSARVRFRYKLHRDIINVTNRCICTLNRMYAPEADIPQQHHGQQDRHHCICFSHSHINRQPDNHVPLSCLSSLPPCHPNHHDHSRVPLLSPSCFCSSSSSTPSRSQLRLLSFIRQHSYGLVCRVRSAPHSISGGASDAQANPADVLSAFSFHAHTVATSTPGHMHKDSSSSDQHRMSEGQHHPARASSVPHLSFHSDLEGSLPVSEWSCVPVPRTSSFSSAVTSVVPLCANRVALPEQLHIIPVVTVLPPQMSAVYGDAEEGPAQLLRHPLEVFELNQSAPLRPPRVAGSRSEYVALIRRLKDVGMIDFTSCPKAVNGIFTVGKDDVSDRLIIDAQPANRLFVDPPHVSLPDPSHLVQLQVPKGRCMFVAKSDLSNFYHHLGLPSWMQPYFALPPLTPEELSSMGASSETAIFPMCVTMPMGWSHAVLLANTCHEHVVYTSGALERENNLLQHASPVISDHRVTHGIVIDDLFLFCLNQSLAQRVFTRILDAYRRAGFVVKLSKVVHPTSDPVKVIGFDISGVHSSVRLPIDSCLSLLRVTLAVLRMGHVSGLGLASLIGRWTWVMLLRRPSLSILQQVYRFSETAYRRRFSLWPSVRKELWMLIGLLPLLHADLSAPVFRNVIATDASELAAGVVCTSLTKDMSRALWPVCSSRSHACLQTLVNKQQMMGVDMRDICRDMDMEYSTSSNQQQQLIQTAAHTYAEMYAEVGDASWSTLVSKAWHTPEHINALELRAVLLALHWALSFPSSHLSRVYLLVDSTVTFFTLWKGRCSSPQLLWIMRKVAALLLANGMQLLTGWIPSAVNPADAPSRCVDHRHM